MLTSRFVRNVKVVPRMAASTQTSLTVPGASTLDTASGVKAMLMESPVSDTALSQHLKKDIADVSLVVKAGPRFESDVQQELGLAQALKTFSLLTHDGSTVVRSVGTLESMGCEFGITVTRELMIYKLSCEKQYLNDVLPFVTAALSQPRFAKWELGPTKYQAKLDRSIFEQDAVAVTVDLLHKAAFRKGLGNSLCMTDEEISALSPEKMLSYHEKHFNPSNVFLVSNNAPGDVIQSNFEHFGKSADSSSASLAKPTASEFISDEIRSDDNTLNHVTVALASASGATNTKQAIVHAVLANLLQGSSDHGLGMKNLLTLPLDEECGEWVKAFQVDYSDAGLFGFLLHADHLRSGKLVSSLMSTLKSLESSLTDDHVLMGKMAYLRSLYSSMPTPSLQTEHMASHMILGTAIGHQEFDALVQSVSKDDLKKALSEFLSGPKSMAAHGNCSNVPFLEEL